MSKTAIDYTLEFLALLPSLAQLGEDVKAQLDTTAGVLRGAQAEGRDPTTEEWDAINAVVAGLRTKLDE